MFIMNQKLILLKMFCVKVYERNEPMKKELDSNECKLVAQQSSPLTNIPIH